MAASFPPHKSLKSKPVSAQIALQHLTAYLDAAATQPHLLPNATLQPTGPVAQSGATSNLTIQHLQRVQAGLRGEWLQPIMDLEEEKPVEVEGSGKGKKTTFDDDWVDMDTYNQAQEVVTGDGTNVSVHAEMVDESAEAIEPVEGKKDKETRKKEKKDREDKRKAEKAAEARAAAASA